MKYISTLLALFCVTYCFTQHSENATCTLKPENKEWLSEFKKTDLGPEQIDLVIHKITADATYFVENPEIENLEDKRVFGTLPCTQACSIRFGLVYGKGKGLTLDLNQNPELEPIMAEFTPENISRIELNEHHSKDRYKTAGIQRSGIILYTDDKELKKKIKRAIKDMRKS